MERHDRPAVATFFAAVPWILGEQVALSESAAHHVRVKRLCTGDPVRLTDGQGRRSVGSIRTIAKTAVTVDVHMEEVVRAPRAIHLRVPVADRDRMLWLAEKATELGVTSWQAVRFRRSASVSPRGEGPVFGEKIHTRMVSALEQSGGAWLPRILADTSLEDLVSQVTALPILLDAAGGSLANATRDGLRAEPTVLLGPEGGMEEAELSSLDAAGWRRVRLATNVLRFETAGIAAVAALRAMESCEE